MVSCQQRTFNSCQSRFDPSSHIGYAYVRTPEKKECLRRLHQDSHKVKLHINILEKKLTSATAQDGVNLTDKLHGDFMEIASENTSKVYLSLRKFINKTVLGPATESKSVNQHQ